MSGCQAAGRGPFIESDLVVRNAWRRGLTWPRFDVRRCQCAALVGAMVLLQLAAGAFTPLDAQPVVIGLWMATPTLLAIWAVFGSQPIAVRLPLTLWLAAANYLALLYGAWRAAREYESPLFYFAVWVLAYLVVQLPLWPLRAAGWRLEVASVADRAATPSAAPVRLAAKSAWQFSTLGLLVWTLAVAVLLAVLREVVPDELPDGEDFLDALPTVYFFGVLLALSGVLIGPVAWIMLASGRRLVLRTALLSLLLALLPGGILLHVHLDESITASESACLEAGMIANGVACLMVVAACGLRLQRRPRAGGCELSIQGGVGMAPIAWRRVSLGALPLVAIAIIVAREAPEQLDQWRQEDIDVKWRRGGFKVWFDTDGILYASHIFGAAASDEALDEIARLNCQKNLALDGAKIDDGQLALLAPMTDLQVLELDNCEITDVEICQLPPLDALRKLNLWNTRVSDAGVAHLVNLPNLEWLHLEGTDITDEGLLILARLPKLSSLRVSMTAVTAAGAKRFLAARPEVELMYGASDQYLGRHLQFLGHITDLFEGMLPCSRNPTLPVRRLHLRGTMPVADSGPVLKVTDAALAALADLTELEDLDLRDTNITDRGLPSLAKLTALRRLDLRGTRVGEQAIAELSKSLPGCEILRPAVAQSGSRPK